MRHYLFAIFFLPSFFFLIASCDPPLGCNCPKADGIFFRTTGLELNFIDENLGVNVKVISDSAEVAQNNLRTNMKFDVEYYNTAANTIKFDWNSLTNSALACECITNGESGSKERIESLEITTAYDIDAQHPAGSIINDLVILSQRSLEISFDVLSTFDLYYDNFDLEYTATLPTGKFAVSATMKMQNGSTYKASSVTIKLK